jgi:Uma2 family endonuclease
MATVLDPATDPEASLTIADLYRRFGPMLASRIRMDPEPGTATEDDLLYVLDHEDALCELIDGILVEKPVGSVESFLAMWIGTLLNIYVRRRKLGAVLGSDGPIRFRIGLVRLPDVCFISRERLPGGKFPKTPILRIVPNLAVEVLSRSNTAKEMRQKLKEYFKAGVELVWYVDPRTRTVQVFTAPNKSEMLKENQTLTGGTVLPGFKLKLRKLFAELDD